MSLSVTPVASEEAFRFKEAYVLYDTNDEDARITILRRRSNEVELKLIDLPEPRILTFLDANYPGWRAYVDGSPVPILLANDAFKAVVVPEGTHDVRFVYRCRSLYTGLGISTVTVLGIGALFLAVTLRRKRPS